MGTTSLSDTNESRLSPFAFWGGAVSLLLAVAASVVLVVQRHGDLRLPGCGLQSACATITSGPWGRLPGLDWPLSHIGAAYFLALLLTWLVRGGRLGSLRWVMRVGVLGSLLLMAVMVQGAALCPYCLMVHLGNLGCWGVVEFYSVSADGSKSTMRVFAASWGVLLGVLIGLDEVAKREETQAAEQSRRESVVNITNSDASGSTRSLRDASGKSSSNVSSVPLETSEGSSPFTGRYRVGPEVAAIRLVIISDYQCPDCRGIEQQLRQVLEERDDVSFSAKHFPFCVECNRAAKAAGKNLHPNACWAARAAEAAGILGGDAGFAKMHRWLFDQKGTFTESQLHEAAADLGFQADTFLKEWKGQETLGRVKEDIEEAMELGLHQTPMIFVNGQELKGWQAPDALLRTVEEVAKTAPTPATAGADQPPRGTDKYFLDWQEAPRQTMPADRSRFPMGSPEGVEVVMWGDFQEPYTADLDRNLRRLLRARPTLRYDFRHYPFHQDCNPTVPRSQHPYACVMSKAAEAAGQVSGSEAYWTMHAWLMEHSATFQPGDLEEAGRTQGLDMGQFQAAMDSDAVEQAIREDAFAARKLGLTGMPFLWIDGRRFPGRQVQNLELLERVLDSVK